MDDHPPNGVLVNGDRIYVASTSAIVAYDATTLTPVKAYALEVTPDRLAFAAGKIWFSYGAGELGSLDLAASEITFFTAGSASWSSSADLDATPGAPGTLVISGKSSGVTDVAVLDVSGETPTVTAERTFAGEWDAKTALSADGTPSPRR
ncbi:hypothetical protein ACWKSP_20915 [Micromonosporaceae bacterium Da 78-11]